MEKEQQKELLEKLEEMVSFREMCLHSGNWEDYDKAEENVRRIKAEIVKKQE